MRCLARGRAPGAKRAPLRARAHLAPPPSRAPLLLLLSLQQILDKEEYTLEELLDEDDIIQECKSLNGRLIAL